MKEQSKVFIRMGELVNIKAMKRSQRGIIARRALVILEDHELDKFSNSFSQFEFRSIKVNQGEKSWML